MDNSTVLNNKEKERAHGACSHVLTFETHAEQTTFTCVKCGHSETVRSFD